MVIEVAAGDITRTPVDGILVSLCEDSERLGLPSSAVVAVDALLGGAIATLLDSKAFKGKPNEVAVVHSLGNLPARLVGVCGLGRRSDLSVDRVRDAVAEGCRALRKMGCRTVAAVLMGAGAGRLDPLDSARATAEGAVLGLYQFTRYKASEVGDVERLSIIVRDPALVGQVRTAAAAGEVLALATNLSRDMTNEPANYMTPTRMAETARELGAKHGFDVTVLDRPEMERLGMGGLLSVSQGSAEPAKFIRLDYRQGAADAAPLGLIGKAITFDSGGISIKPSDGLQEMKDDMAGGAGVIAALCAISQLQVPANVSCLIPATENLPGGRAFRPGDVLRTIGGKTVEIFSTDAEGRLILADAIGYGIKEGFSPLVDIATLTGACRIALGTAYSGVFSNRQELADRFLRAGARAGEKMWQLPLADEYRELNKSQIADIKNVGNRYGGAITAALFLSEFAGETPWLHVDIAGTTSSSKDAGITVKGATGVPVRTLFEFVRGD